jgi:hypothetical protein
MSVRPAATYIPLATERTKNVIKHIQHGASQKIDAISIGDHSERIETDLWVVEHHDGIHTYYQDGPAGSAVDLGFIDQVRIAIEEAATEE